MSRLDFTNPTAVSQWLGGLCTSLHDADAVSRDMLRPERERNLGPVLHAEHYAAAWDQIQKAMAFAGAPLDGPEGGDEPPPASRPRSRSPDSAPGGDPA
jgi:hypothetical protein